MMSMSWSPPVVEAPARTPATPSCDPPTRNDRADPGVATMLSDEATENVERSPWFEASWLTLNESEEGTASSPADAVTAERLVLDAVKREKSSLSASRRA